MKTLIFIVLSFIIVMPNLAGQCTINHVQVSYSNCDSSGQFYATLSLEHQNTSESFIVIGNGKNYGRFQYSQLPTKIGPLKADCETNYEFVAVDLMDDNCRGFAEGGIQCCPKNCNFIIAEAENTKCENDLYSSIFSLIGNYGENGIDIYHNGKFISTIDHPESRIRVNNLSASKIENYDKLVVCAHNDQSCCDTLYIANPCICNIYNLRSQIVDCNEQDGTFSVSITFDHLSTSDSFNLGGNSTNYGKYAFKDLPITIKGLKFDSTKIYEFVVSDNKKSLCYNFIEIGPVANCHFPCSIEKIKVVTTDCSKDGKIYAYLTFRDHNTSVKGFTVRGNGHQYGSFQYGHAPYRVGHLTADCHTIYEFEVRDNNIDGCFSSAHLSSPLCCDSICSISNLDIKEVCDGEKLQYISINFAHKNSFLGKFKVSINGQLIGIYNYNDLPINIESNKLTGKLLEIRIADFENENCLLESRYEIRCALQPCQISNFKVEPLPCNDLGFFDIFIKFEAKSVSKKGYILKVNGEIFDTLPYSEHGYTLHSLKGDCKTKYNFVIYDIENTKCAADFKLDKPVCCDDKPCSLSNPKIKIGECIHGLYSLQLNFTHSGNTTDFILRINGGNAVIYKYADLPVVIKELNADQPIVIQIFDKEKEPCRLEVSLPSIDCTSATDEMRPDELRIFHDNVTLQIVSNNEKALSILGLYNLQGQLIDCPTDKSTIDIHQLNAGIYILSIKSGDTLRFKRFIKF